MIYTFRKEQRELKRLFFFNLKKGFTYRCGLSKGVSRRHNSNIFWNVDFIFFKYLTTSITQDIMVAFDDDSFFDLKKGTSAPFFFCYICNFF